MLANKAAKNDGFDDADKFASTKWSSTNKGGGGVGGGGDDVIFPSNIGDYIFIRDLGKGAFGKVWEGDYRGRRVGIKSLNKAKIQSHGGPRMIERVRNEISLHYHLNNSNIIELYFFFEDDDFVYMILELGEYELYKALRMWRNSTSINNELNFFNDPSFFKRIFEEVVDGLSYLHSLSIMHRDLKLSNILLVRKSDGFLQAKIADFGLAIRSKESNDSSSSYLREDIEEEQTMCGTPNYLAPEIVRKQTYGPSADIWSLGCLLYTMLVGRPPFESSNGDINETFHRLQRAQFTFPPSFRDPLAKDLITSLLKCSPLERASINDIKRHPFLLNNRIIDDGGLTITTNTINLANLKPTRQETRYYIFDLSSIGDDENLLTVEDKKDNRKLFIKKSCPPWCESPMDGTADMGRREGLRRNDDFILLDNAKRFISLLRSKTPHVIFKCPTFTSFLMENLPKPDYLLKFLDGSRLHLKTLENVMLIMSDRNVFPLMRINLSERIDFNPSKEIRHIMDVGIKNYKEISSYLKSLRQADDHQMVKKKIPLRITKSSNGNIVEFTSLGELTSTDYLTQYRKQQHNNNNNEFDNFDTTIKAYLPNIGWCMAGPKGKFMLLFSDGYTLLVDGPSNRVAFTQVGMDNRYGGGGGTNTLFLPINSSLPSLYKEKLSYLPKFIEKLREGLGHTFC